MVDWQGFLKWSLNYQDGTKETEIPKMSEEQREFLQKAIEAYTFDEVKRMKEILQLLTKQVTDQDKLDENVDLVDELIELLTGIDNAMNFCKIGGIYLVFEWALNQEVDTKLRDLFLVILIDCSQNNSFVQSFMQKIQFWKLMRIW